MNGRTNTSIVVYGTRVMVKCLTGYMFKDGGTSLIVECLENGVWSRNYTDCVGKAIRLNLLTSLIYSNLQLYWFVCHV